MSNRDDALVTLIKAATRKEGALVKREIHVDKTIEEYESPDYTIRNMAFGSIFLVFTALLLRIVFTTPSVVNQPSQPTRYTTPTSYTNYP